MERAVGPGRLEGTCALRAAAAPDTGPTAHAHVNVAKTKAAPCAGAWVAAFAAVSVLGSLGSVRGGERGPARATRMRTTDAGSRCVRGGDDVRGAYQVFSTGVIV